MLSNEDKYLLKQLLEYKRQLNNLSKKTDDYCRILSCYNETLDIILFSLQKPLDDLYEIDENDMLEDYVSFKKDYIKHGPFTFSKFINMVDIIAIVTIKKIPFFKSEIIVETNEIFKGRLNKKEKIIFSQNWGRPQNKWLRKDAMNLIFSDGRRPITTFGRLGIMPLDKVENEMVVYSFIDNNYDGFFDELNYIQRSDMLCFKLDDIKTKICFTLKMPLRTDETG